MRTNSADVNGPSSLDGMDDLARIGELIRKRRMELRMSQAELAEAAGVGTRQIRRYENGDQQPLLTGGIAIARALKMPVTELAGAAVLHRVNLAGEWWMSWQTSQHGQEVVTAQAVLFEQQDDLISMQTVSRGNVTLEQGGYNWQGELRLWDNRVLMGWYAADDGAVNSKGTVYFVLHNHGVFGTGIWAGCSHDGDLLSGWGAMARTEAEARELIDKLKATMGALRTAPPDQED